MARTAAQSHHRRAHGSRARHSWSRNREWLRRSQVVAHRAPRSDAVDRSSPAAVPDAASAARDVASSFSRLRKTRAAANYRIRMREVQVFILGRGRSTFGAQPFEDIATQQPTMRELRASARANILSSPATNSYARLVLQKAARTAGKRGRERQWTLGQALRCSLHFLPSSY